MYEHGRQEASMQDAEAAVYVSMAGRRYMQEVREAASISRQKEGYKGLGNNMSTADRRVELQGVQEAAYVSMAGRRVGLGSGDSSLCEHADRRVGARSVEAMVYDSRQKLWECGGTAVYVSIADRRVLQGVRRQQSM
jgi:hypothetical protein